MKARLPNQSPELPQIRERDLELFAGVDTSNHRD